MLFSGFLCGVIETALNAALAVDPHSSVRLRRLNGRSLSLSLNEFGVRWFLVFSGERVMLLEQWQAPPDCALKASLGALGQMQDGAQLTRLIQQGQLQLEGDLQVAQQVAALFQELQIDLEELLDPWMGEAGAHLVVAEASRVRLRLHQAGEQLRRQLAELVTEEQHLAPGALEVAAFCDEVDLLKGQVDLLEQRMQGLSSGDRQKRPAEPRR